MAVLHLRIQSKILAPAFLSYNALLLKNVAITNALVCLAEDVQTQFVWIKIKNVTSGDK